MDEKTVTLTENEWNAFYGFVNRCLEEHGVEADPVTYDALGKIGNQLGISTGALGSSASTAGRR